MKKRVKIEFQATLNVYYVKEWIEKSKFIFFKKGEWSVVQEKESYNRYINRRFKEYSDAKEYAELCLIDVELCDFTGNTVEVFDRIEYQNHTILVTKDKVWFSSNDTPDLKLSAYTVNMAKKLIDFDVEHKKEKVMKKLKGEL